MKRFLKKGMAALLSAVMVVTAVPKLAKEVHAAENQLPTKEQFATVEELKSFNTNDNDGVKNPAKVYFGNNNQKWWIAGSKQEQGLTLFAASPLATRAPFKSSTSDGTYDGKTVNANHYGASDIKKTVKGLETTYFTNSEQDLMTNTTIYTNDTKNSSTYSTIDKLYLAYGEFFGSYITVGTNSQDNLNNGLRVDNVYFGNSYFWLRAPSPYRNYNYYGLSTRENDEALHDDVYKACALVPAFELNLSSVIFASAAPAASSDGNLNTNDAYTLRYKTQDDIGTATISQSKGSIAVTDIANENTYLVVQNSQGAWSKKVSSNDLVFASDIDSSLTSFENCKVWLETTSDRITYAEEATQGSGHNVKVNVGENLTVNGGNILQMNVSGNITEIIVKANDGYYVPDDYKDSIQGLNGLNVKDVTQTGFIISGTPTSDVNIILPAATVLPKADTPEVTISKTKASITATVTNHKTEFGDIEYKWNDGNWEKDKNTLSNLQADTTYKLVVRFKGNGVYQPSDEYSVDITTLKDGKNVIVLPTGLTTTYKEGLKLSDVDLSGTGWTWIVKDMALSVGTNSYPVSFDTTALESTTDFSGVDGYDAINHKVIRKVEVKVNKADSSISITNTLDKAYDGNTVTTPEYTTSGSNGKVTIKWQENTGSVDTPKWEDLKSAPSTVGTYRVVVELAGNDNYNSASAALDFVISKATNTWVEELSITGWTYNDKANAPSATAKYGKVVYTYSSEENGTYTNEVPKNAGTWYVKATVAGTENYTGLESVISFTIAKADTTLAFEKDNIDKTYDKNVISEPKVSKTGSSNDIVFEWYIADENGWQKLDNAPSDVGTYKVVASVTEDTNYNGASIEKPFKITSSDSDITIKSEKDTYVYEDQITLDVSVNLAKKLSFFERLFTNDNTVTAYVGDTAISSSVELDKNNHATLTIDTKDEQVRKVLKPSDQKLTITVKYNGSENLNNTKNDISIMLHKKDTTVSFKDTAFNLSRVYNGKSVTVDVENDIHKTKNAPEVTLNWNTEDGTALDTAPSKVGKYQLIVSIPEDAYYKGSSVQHDFEISKAELSVEVKVKDKQYDGFNTAEIETAALVGVAEGDQITLINGIPTFDSVEVGENIAIHFTAFTLEAEEDVLNNYTLIQPTGVTASITNTWVPKKDVEYTTSQPNGNGWVKEDFKIQAKEGYLLAFGNKADGSRSTNWSKELAGSKEGANSIAFYVKNEQTGSISTQTTENYKLDKTKPEVNGLEKDKVYCKEITFTVEETNLDVVKVNEKALTPNEKGVYTLTAGNHQITVMDQAGNETVLAVIVNAEHTPNADDGDCTTPITCAVCGTVVKEAQEHSFTTYTSDSNAGCLTDGTKTAKCDHEGCTQTKTVEDEGSALGHDWGEWEIVTSPDCENKGSEKRICKRCSLTETKDLDASGHDWEDDFTVDQDATCTQEGSKSIHCKNCDAVKDSTSIPSTGHAYGEPKWNWSEDGKAATVTFTCQNDSSHVETKTAEVTSTVKEPATCTQEGITTYTATITFEGNVYTDTKDVADIGALGHDWEEEHTIDKEATCTEEGSKSIHCKNCDATKDSTVIPATGHVYGEPKWSWSEDGKAATITFICQNNSGHIETKAAEITSTVKEPAMCTQEGITAYTAIVTFEGNVYTDTKDVADIGALGHDWEEEYTIDQEATCTEEGSKSIHCKNCDAMKDTMVIPATGHKNVHGECTVCGWKDPNYQEQEVGGGSGNSWNKGDEKGLAVQTPGEIGKVTDVTLNGKPLVEGTDYVVNDGTVILKPNVLEELKEGNHTLIIYGEKGYAETQIKIEKNTTSAPQQPGSPENKEPNQGTGNPETGDSVNVGLWFGLLFISIGGIFSTYFYKKKKRN